MFIVSIDLDAYESLPPRQLKAMLRALRFADREGLVHASLTMLAMPGLSRSSVHRELHAIEEEGHVDRQERLWRIGRRFTSVRKPAGDVPTAETPPVPQAGTPDSRAPAVKFFSSSENQNPEREQQAPSEGEIPEGWKEAATTVRRRVDLPDVELRVEWRKLAIHDGTELISRRRWLTWAMRARLDRTNTPAAPSETVASRNSFGGLPGDERQQRQARDWARTGFWLRSGAWGPAPDQPGCTLPPDLVAWCLAERTRSAA